jgi:hypothetical protein
MEHVRACSTAGNMSINSILFCSTAWSAERVFYLQPLISLHLYLIRLRCYSGENTKPVITLLQHTIHMLHAQPIQHVYNSHCRCSRYVEISDKEIRFYSSLLWTEKIVIHWLTTAVHLRQHCGWSEEFQQDRKYTNNATLATGWEVRSSKPGAGDILESFRPALRPFQPSR